MRKEGKKKEERNELMDEKMDGYLNKHAIS